MCTNIWNKILHQISEIREISCSGERTFLSDVASKIFGATHVHHVCALPLYLCLVAPSSSFARATQKSRAPVALGLPRASFIPRRRRTRARVASFIARPRPEISRARVSLLAPAGSGDGGNRAPSSHGIAARRSGASRVYLGCRAENDESFGRTTTVRRRFFLPSMPVASPDFRLEMHSRGGTSVPLFSLFSFSPVPSVNSRHRFFLSEKKLNRNEKTFV